MFLGIPVTIVNKTKSHTQLIQYYILTLYIARYILLISQPLYILKLACGILQHKPEALLVAGPIRQSNIIRAQKVL